MMTVGLTGGIGSGKSTVAQLLLTADPRITLIDADAQARVATAPAGPAITAIQHHFGPAAIASDGSLNRTAMRQQIFNDPEARQQLESIIHPFVRREIARAMDAAVATGTKCVIVDIPLLVESKSWAEQFDRIVVVDCSEKSQMRRVCQRNALDEASVGKVIEAQASRAARRTVADALIFNDRDDMEGLTRQVVQLLDYLQL